MKTQPIESSTAAVTTKIKTGGGVGILVLATVVALVILVGLGVQGRTGGAATPDQEIRATVTGGIDSLYSATLAGPKGELASSISASALSTRRSKLPTIFAQYFVGEPLDLYSRTTQAAMSDQLTQGERDVDGGANVTITSVKVDGAGASVTARAFIWLQSQNVAGGSEPKAQGWWDYNLHLMSTSDGWRIDSINFSPEPGTEMP